jgi:nucleoside-diphosphate-sugar epimerase
MKILLTGGTGFLGSYLIPRLLKDNHQILVLVRKNTFETGGWERLVKNLEETLPESLWANISNVSPLIGDLSLSEILEDSSSYASLKNFQVDTVLHAAALYDLQGNEHQAYLNNVVGTQNLLSFIEREQLTSVKSFHFISSVAVSGDYFGTFYEDELDRHQKFANPYSKTKFISESCVRQVKFSKNFNIIKRIYRLGILVGDSQTGKFNKVDGPYYFLNILKRIMAKYSYPASKMKKLGIPFLFPYAKSSLLPLLPIDEAARALSEMISNPKNIEQDLKSYHVIAPESLLIEDLIVQSLQAFNLNVDLVAIPPNKMNEKILAAYQLPKELLIYLFSECEYDQSSLRKDYPELLASLPAFSQYKDSFFQFVKDN